MGMIRRGSLPSIAVTCAGLSSFTRSGPETGMGEGSVIASAYSLNVRSGRMRRGAILVASAIPLFLIAMWVRTPALPRSNGTSMLNGPERINAAEGAIRALERELTDTQQRLAERATQALDAPADRRAALPVLSSTT